MRLTSHMIAPKALFDTSLTSRTLLRRLFNPPLTGQVLLSLVFPIRSIIILLARLALVPSNMMLNAVTFLTLFAFELRCSWSMNLSGFTSFGNAPPEIWDAFVCRFSSELGVPVEHFFGGKLANVGVLHASGADGAIDLVPDLDAGFGLDPCSEAATAYGGIV